jgi:hypothetical protein
MWTIIEPEPPATLADTLPDFNKTPETSKPIAADSSFWRLVADTLVVCMLLFAIPAQLLLFHFDAVTQHATLRPVLDQVCRLLKCELPIRQDHSQLFGAELNIDDHPELQGIKMLSMSIRNAADFAQPYPALLLSFSDVAGNTVASRLFQPDVYLADHLDSPTALVAAPDSQIPALILFADPGANAVNYRVNLMPPEGRP